MQFVVHQHPIIPNFVDNWLYNLDHHLLTFNALPAKELSTALPHPFVNLTEPDNPSDHVTVSEPHICQHAN